MRRFIVALIVIGLGFPAVAQDNPEKAGVSQEAKTLKRNNLILSQKIAKLYQTLNSYVELYEYYKPKDAGAKGGINEQWRAINKIPRQTILKWLRKDNKPQGEVIGFSLLQYDFVYPEAKRGITEPWGMREKSIELYFDENRKLVKVVSKLKENDFKNHTQKSDTVIDEKPQLDPETVKYVPHTDGSEKIDLIDDIRFKHVFTNGSSYEKILADMKLEISNPHRIGFKRDFYIKHLQHFENLFRLTEDYQRSDRDQRDAVVIEELKETLDY